MTKEGGKVLSVFFSLPDNFKVFIEVKIYFARVLMFKSMFCKVVSMFSLFFNEVSLHSEKHSLCKSYIAKKMQACDFFAKMLVQKLAILKNIFFCVK